MRCVTTVFLVLLGTVLGLSRAVADGECFKGYHDITPEESATMTAVLESARAAVPAPPGGWINTLNDDSVSPPQSVCLDFSPWMYAYTRHYSRVEGHEAREQAEAAVAEQIRAMMAERQPRLDALMAQMSEASTESAAAATSGDSARLAAAQAEMDRLTAQYQQFVNEGNPTEIYEAAMAGHYVDLEMSIAVKINPLAESAMEGAHTIEVSGASSAWQWTFGDDGQQGTALVLFGAWRPAASGYGLETTETPGVAPEQPQAISVRISAHKDRLLSMIGTTDFSAIEALLKR